jgi:hypothetical protein
MKSIRSFTLAGAAVAVEATLLAAANAQSPYDKIIVDLPYTVTIHNKTLDPGHYVIRQMEDMGAGRVTFRQAAPHTEHSSN